MKQLAGEIVYSVEPLEPAILVDEIRRVENLCCVILAQLPPPLKSIIEIDVHLDGDNGMETVYCSLLSNDGPEVDFNRNYVQGEYVRYWVDKKTLSLSPRRLEYEPYRFVYKIWIRGASTGALNQEIMDIKRALGWLSAEP